jgi:hypothetical protein
VRPVHAARSDSAPWPDSSTSAAAASSSFDTQPLAVAAPVVAPGSSMFLRLFY